jgi:hypothetical protein
MPAEAAVEIVLGMPNEGALAIGADRLAAPPSYYSHAGYSADYGKLVVLAELQAEPLMLPMPDPQLITSRTASILAGPFSWAMMTVGLLAIGWTMRSRLTVTNVSFV